MPRLRARPDALSPVRPHAGLQAVYRRRILALVGEMARSYEHWIRAQYRRTPPKMAMDALSSDEFVRLLKDMGARWSRRFNDAAPRLAKYFLQSVRTRSEADLQRILRDAGISVRFRMTPELRDIMKAEIAENVALIRSIQQQYHSQVEGMVMRSVVEGRDLSMLVRELRERYTITRKRAELIARDQNNKATSAIQRERQTSLGIEKGVWLHSHAGKEPRPTHLANHGKEFSVKDGWYDPDPRVRKNIWPGQLINCRCTWKPVVRGFS